MEQTQTEDRIDSTNKRKITGILFILFLIGIASCTVFKAAPIAPTSFLQHGAEMQHLPEEFPFDSVWIADKEKLSILCMRFSRLILSPVQSNLAEEKIRDLDFASDILKDRIEELHEMARYIEVRFESEINDIIGRPIQIVEAPVPDTLGIELALIEVRPRNTAISIVGTVGGILVPFGGVVRLFGKGSIAIEGKIKDAYTQELLFEFKDREIDKTAPFSIKDFQRYAHIREVIDEWSKDFGKLIATNFKQKIPEGVPVTIDPF
ncbi:MAG: DUF3313 domain-containing protein [SAR324 cluster bacterium]|uniref:DUF3313 domain-containing protein n=1 Tax=SAR324 cluster bacterium TaxID=2024889 RepID=A0A7X9FQK9_9DELT|nr:DUF3313 domain-containing protein [SAR324 cluster bacterium]